jgi:hypothetical protein
MFVLTFLSCSQSSKRKTAVIQDLKYSAHYWHFNQQSNDFEFYLDHYINVDRDGKFLIMRHENWMKNPKYFSGTISDTLRYIINATFSNDFYDSNYLYNVDKNGIYDGLDYCFDYKKRNGESKKIRFIPPNSPDQIKVLSSLLDTFIHKTTKSNIDTLLLNDYIDTLAKLSFAELPPPPKRPPPPLIDVKKFKPKQSE